MAQDASVADLCLHVEASANVDLDDPQSVSSAIASGEVSIVESMHGTTTLAVSTTPTGKAPLTAIFDIEGIEDSLRNIRSACEWE